MTEKLKVGDRVRLTRVDGYDGVPGGTEGVITIARNHDRHPWPYAVVFDGYEDTETTCLKPEELALVVTFNPAERENDEFTRLENWPNWAPGGAPGFFFSIDPYGKVTLGTEVEASLREIVESLVPARFVVNNVGVAADMQINSGFGTEFYVGDQPVHTEWKYEIQPHTNPFVDTRTASERWPEIFGTDENDKIVLKTDANENKKSEVDMVNHPPHYTRGGIEVLDFILAYFADDYLGGQVVKYLARAGHKWNTLEDVKKAKFYLDRKVEEMEAAQ